MKGMSVIVFVILPTQTLFCDLQDESKLSQPYVTGSVDDSQH